MKPLGAELHLRSSRNHEFHLRKNPNFQAVEIWGTHCTVQHVEMFIHIKFAKIQAGNSTTYAVLLMNLPSGPRQVEAIAALPMRMAWIDLPSAVLPAEAIVALPKRTAWIDLPSSVSPADAIAALPTRMA